MQRDMNMAVLLLLLSSLSLSLLLLTVLLLSDAVDGFFDKLGAIHFLRNNMGRVEMYPKVLPMPILRPATIQAPGRSSYRIVSYRSYQSSDLQVPPKRSLACAEWVFACMCIYDYVCVSNVRGQPRNPVTLD